MADIADRIAEVLREHQYNGADLGHHGPRVEYCTCGWSGPGEQVHEGHLAAVLVETLGLTPEYAIGVDYPPRDDYPGRFVPTENGFGTRDSVELMKRLDYPDDAYEIATRNVTRWERDA